ncbi:MAG: hypothetical protein ABIH65_00365 [Nanoarchaeota archaeon]
MITLEDRTEQISTLKEKCIDDKEHQLESFIYEGQKSDFEDVCAKCGDFKINIPLICFRKGLLHYIDSPRYQDLSEYSEHIKKKNKII